MPLTRKQKQQNNNNKQMPTTINYSDIVSRTSTGIKNISLTPIGGFIVLVLSTVAIHWSLVNLYTHFCAPPSIYGLFTTIISLGSPMCYFINIAQVELAKHYINIWSGAGIAILAWMAAKFTTPSSQKLSGGGGDGGDVHA